MPEHELERILDLLLWFGVLGVVAKRNGAWQEMYIHEVYYDLMKLKKLANDLDDKDALLCVHPAFWPFLEVNG